MMAIVFVMGMFLDWLGIVMIVFPIFLPIMDMFGFDRLWIVAVTAVMLQTCFMTPPFGFALFYINTGNLPRRYPVHPDYHRSGNSGNGIPADCIFPPESGSILIFLLSLPAATCAGRLICVKE